MTSAMAAKLESAIHHGHIEQSMLYARQLAEAKAKIIVRMVENPTALTPDSLDMIR